MMITVNSMEEAADQWVNDYVKLLGKPYFHEETQRWRALANAYGMLAIVDLRVTQPQPEKP